MNKALREIAHKVWISDLDSTEFKSGGLVVWGQIVSRVNLVGNVVGRYDKEESYSSITIDDGSAGIRIKTWNEEVRLLRDVKIGNIVLVVGKIRQSSNGEIFVSPEIVKRSSIDWELARKLELIKEFGIRKKEEKIVEDRNEVESSEKEDVVEVIKIGSVRQMILSCVKVKERTFDEIKKEVNYPEEEVDSAIQELINEGELYEVKGVYRILG